MATGTGNKQNGDGGAGKLSKAKRFVTDWIVGRIVKYSNSKLDIGYLQRQYRATKGRIGKIVLEDMGKAWNFQVKDGRLRLLEAPDDVDGGFITTSDVVIALARGTAKVMNPATGELTKEEYTPVDALTRGDLRIWGDAATQDALLFAQAIYKDVYPEIRQELNTDNMEDIG